MIRRLEQTVYRETQQLDRKILMIVTVAEFPIVLFLVVLLIKGRVAWWVLGVGIAGVATAMMLIGLSRIALRVDDTHLRWAFVPFWWGQTALEDIDHLDVVEISALKQFGGWGPKWRPGVFGLIAKSGGAVEITRKSTKTKLVITSDDPDRLADEILRRVLREEGIEMTGSGE